MASAFMEQLMDFQEKLCDATLTKPTITPGI
jgi:hypothetical protein